MKTRLISSRILGLSFVLSVTISALSDIGAAQNNQNNNHKQSTKVNVINVIKQVGGGDQVWFNRGDGRFYVTGLDMTTHLGVQSLGVINAQTSEWLQNVPAVKGKNPAALPENNHIFIIVQINAAIAGGTAPERQHLLHAI